MAKKPTSIIAKWLGPWAELERHLKQLSHAYFQCVKKKQGLTLQMRDLKALDALPEPELHKMLINQESKTARDIVRKAKEFLRRHPVYNVYLSKIRGLGDTTAMVLLGLVPAWRFNTMSQLWAYCGYTKQAVESQKYYRKIKGIMYNAALQMILRKSVYAGVFWKRLLDVEVKALAEGKRNSVQHAFLSALRVMIKMVLGHYWEVYRLLAGLPHRPPYIVEKEGHGKYIPPLVDENHLVPEALKDALRKIYGGKMVGESEINSLRLLAERYSLRDAFRILKSV